MGSLKDLIREAPDLKEQRDIDIPEWSSDVVFMVRALPSRDWEQYQNKVARMRMRDGAGELQMRSQKAEIVARCLYGGNPGEEPELVFPDPVEGAAILAKKSAGIVGALFDLCRHLSDDDRDFKAKVEGAEEDFGAGQS